MKSFFFFFFILTFSYSNITAQTDERWSIMTASEDSARTYFFLDAEGNKMKEDLMQAWGKPDHADGSKYIWQNRAIAGIDDQLSFILTEGFFTSTKHTGRFKPSTKQLSYEEIQKKLAKGAKYAIYLDIIGSDHKKAVRTKKTELIVSKELNKIGRK